MSTAKYQELALKIQRKTYGKTHPRVAVSCLELGEMLRNKGDYGRAEEQLKTALGIREELYGESGRDVAEVWDGLGRV